MKKIAMFLAGVLSSFCAFSAQMASQPWVNARLDELHTNILDEVSRFAPSGGVSKAYVDSGLARKQDKLTAGTGITISPSGVISATGGGGGEQDYNPDTDMWIEDGTNMCFMVGTNKVKFAILSVTSKPYASGLLVIESDKAEGAVSNGMFFAEVETGKFRCPSNSRMPLIEFDGINTQVVDGVTNEYQRVTAIEYERGTNGVTSVNRYESAQKNPTDWIMRSILSDLSVRDFRIRMTMGPALQSEQTSYIRRFSLFDLLVGSVYAGTSMDFDVQGMSGTLNITLDGVKDPIVVPIGYSGQYDFDYAGKDPTVPKVVRSEPDADGKVTVTHFDWDVYPYPSYNSFTALGNWLPSMISYTYTTESGDTYVKNMPISTIQRAFGSQLQAKLASLWKEPQVIEWTSEEYKSCKGDGTLGHYFMAETCKCRYCGTTREHRFNPGDPGMKCKTCINLVGWEKEPSDSYCGGHSIYEEDHGGYHHTPAQGWVPPPSSGSHPGHQGYLVTCTCQCGDFTGNHAYDGESAISYSKGDLLGRDENKYHTKSMGCSRCQLSPYGWKAEVEGHTVSGAGSFVECIKAGTFNDETGEYETCEPEDPNVDREGHAASGKCELCQKPDVNWKVAHKFAGGNSCECTECGAKMHVFYDNTCPGVAWCLVCNKVFAVQGGVVNYNLVLDQETEPSYHTYSDPESQIPENYVNHWCLCVRKILHPHTWYPVPGDDTGKQVCGAAPDGTAGCGMEMDHNEETCDEEKCIPYGKCGDWKCKICNKDISEYEGAPRSHGNKDEEGSYGPVKDADGNITYCAVCKHSFKGVKCWTSSEGVYTPYKIPDPELHIGWKPQSGTLGARDTYHECACKAYSRFHNWNDYRAENMNDRYHRVLRECNLDRFDDCYYKGSYEERHNFVWQTDETTGLPSFSVNPGDPDQCGAATICRTIHNGTDIGCWRTGHDYGSHQWVNFETLGEPSSTWYTWASRDKSDFKYDYHVKNARCEHRHRGKDGRMHYCGCHIQRPSDDFFYEVGSPGASLHNKVYDSVYLDATYHTTHVTCDKKNQGCDFLDEASHKHNYQHIDWEYVDNDYHREVKDCRDNGPKNPGCHYTNRLVNAYHQGPLQEITYINNYEHTRDYLCLKCNNFFFELEEHPVFDLPDGQWGFHEKSTNYVYDTTTGCIWGMHESSTICPDCNTLIYQPYLLACDYDWSLSDDGVVDSGTCKLCGGQVQNPCHFTWNGDHIEGTRCFNEEYHACFHTVRVAGGYCMSPAHLFGQHNTNGHWNVDHTYLDEGACSVCGYKRGYIYAGILEPKMPDLNPQSWENFIANCGLSQNPTTWDPFLRQINGDEPVYSIAYNSLAGFFRGCEYLNDVRFNFCKEVETYALLDAFADCTALKSIGFRDLEDAGGASFQGAFVNCTSLVDGVSFPSMTFARDNSFGHAFTNCTSLKAAKFNALEDNQQSSFEDSFIGCTSLECADFRSLSNTAEYSFRNAFAGCSSLTNANFKALQTAGYNSFDGAFVGCTSLTNADFGNLSDAREYSFFGAFSNCVNLANVDFGGLVDGSGYAHDYSFGSAFSGCPKLKHLDFTNLSDISEGMFSGNECVREMIFSNPSSIGRDAFKGCSSLDYIYFRMTDSFGVPALVDANAFDGVNDETKIVVHGDLYDEWRTSSDWADVAWRIVPDRVYDTNCNFYVSDLYGSDSNDGLTPSTAKRTIDAAIALATNNQVIGLMFGHYNYPSFNSGTSTKGCDYPVKIVGLSRGVYIDKPFIGNEYERAYVTGCQQTWTAFENVTFRNLNKGTTSRWCFLYCYLYNCTFEDCIVTQREYRAPFVVSVLERCKIRNFEVNGYGGYGDQYILLNPSIFDDCVIYDSEIEVRTTPTVPDNKNLSLGNVVHAENCYFRGGGFYSAELYSETNSANFETDSRWCDSTIIPDMVIQPNGWSNRYNPPGSRKYIPLRLDNCLVGIDGMTNNPPDHVSSIITNREVMAGAIDPETKRPDDEHSDWRTHGYRGIPMMLNRNGGRRKVQMRNGGVRAPVIYEDDKEDGQ